MRGIGVVSLDQHCASLCDNFSHVSFCSVLHVHSYVQVADARRAAGKLGPVTFLLDPELRELNRNQKRGRGALTWRHRGTVRAVPRKRILVVC